MRVGDGHVRERAGADNVFAHVAAAEPAVPFEAAGEQTASLSDHEDVTVAQGDRPHWTVAEVRERKAHRGCVPLYIELVVVR